MPTYQYECSACGYQFEAFQSMTETRLKQCPQCAKNTLDRLIGTGSGIIFKGSGFYETDYKRKESKPETCEKTSCPMKSDKKLCPKAELDTSR